VIANPPNSAQLEGTPAILPNYIRVHAVVWECGEGQTDTLAAMDSIHFASAMPHAKSNDSPVVITVPWLSVLLCRRNVDWVGGGCNLSECPAAADDASTTAESGDVECCHYCRLDLLLPLHNLVTCSQYSLYFCKLSATWFVSRVNQSQAFLCAVFIFWLC